MVPAVLQMDGSGMTKFINSVYEADQGDQEI